MKDFEFPTNIKQIGSIGEGLRIYIEDYAYSYLQQYADMPGGQAQLAFLVGRALVIDGQKVLFISGVVRGEHTDTDKEARIFTARSFEQANKEIERYFKDLGIVGWMYSQPGFGLRIPTGVEAYHTRAFPGVSEVCLVMDGEQKLSAFYINKEGAEKKLVETKGFFIYYDKNRAMHEYMLDNKVSKIKVVSAYGKGFRDETEEVDAASMDMSSGEVAVARIRKNYSQRKIKAGDRPKALEGTQKDTRHIKLRMAAPSQRSLMSLTLTFCLVLFMASLVMGAGLLQNVERVDLLERQLQELGAAYRGLVVEVGMFSQEQGDAIATVAPGTALEPPQPAVTTSDAIPQTTEQETVATQAQAGNQAEVSQGHINIEEIINQLQSMGEQEEQPQAQQAELTYLPLEYVVVQGDTLSDISRRFYGTTERMEDIMEYNGLDNPNAIMVGSILRLPRR